MLISLKVTYRVVLYSIVLSLFCTIVVAQGVNQGKIRELTAKLAKISRDKKAVQAEIESANQAFFKFQHDVVYTNAALTELYKEIKSLEKSLVEKKKELSDVTHQLPEMRKIKKDRETVYKKLRYLKERERLIQNEITAMRMAAGKVKKPE